MLKTLTFIFALIAGAALVAAQESIPAQAQEIAANVYRYMDSAGRTWLYCRTPFGISKREDKPDQRAIALDPTPMKVIDLGARVRFEVQTPFGVSIRVTPKTELTDAEKALLNPQPVAEKQ